MSARSDKGMSVAGHVMALTFAAWLVAVMVVLAVASVRWLWGAVG